MENEQEEFMCKETVRSIALKTREGILNREQKSRVVCDKIVQALDRQVGNTLCYFPIGSELDTREIITKLYCYLPYTVQLIQAAVPLKLEYLYNTNAIKADKLGNVPLYYLLCDDDVSFEEIAFSITPALAVNSNGHRLGYGKGCYDLLFNTFTDIIRIGVCFDEQLIEFSPDKLDARLDCVVTPSKVLYFTNRARYLKI